MKHDQTATIEAEAGNLRQYMAGFALSLILTISAYFAADRHLFSHTIFVGVVMVLAILQLFVQLSFFLDLDREAKPKWKSKAFMFMLLVVITIVVGSLWIMANLNYGHQHGSTPSDTNTFIIKDEGFKP